MMMEEAERRIVERSDCAIDAKIELNDRLAVTVTVRDISTAGARLQAASGIHLPDEFDLLVPIVENVEQRFRVRVAWRNGDMIGVGFLQLSSPAIDAYDREAERRYGEYRRADAQRVADRFPGAAGTAGEMKEVG